MRKQTLGICVVTLALATACTTPLMMASTSRPLDGQAYQVVGETRAEACIQTILGIPISTDASLKTALAQAREAIKADALIEVTVDQYSLVTGFYNQNCTVVNALGVRLTGQQAPFLKPVPAVPAVPAKPAPATAPASPPAVEEPPAAPATPAAKPAEPVKPAKKLTRAERRRLAREEARRKRAEAKKAKRKAAEEKKQAVLAAKAKAAEDKRKAAEDKKKAEEDKKKAEEAAKRKAEEDAKKAELARKAAEEAKPVPAEFAIFCKYKPGQPVLVETKAEKIEADFVKCVHFGVRVKKSGQEPGVIPFETIWSVRMRAPAAASPATPATPAKPAQPRQ